jgi:hypothetical protein
MTGIILDRGEGNLIRQTRRRQKLAPPAPYYKDSRSLMAGMQKVALVATTGWPDIANYTLA